MENLNAFVVVGALREDAAAAESQQDDGAIDPLVDVETSDTTSGVPGLGAITL